MPIIGSVTVNGFQFNFGEISYGKGRGIRVSSGGDSSDYMIKPNPHNDRYYNKKTRNWYLECAESFGENYTVAATDDELAQLNWPAGDAAVTVNDIDYELQVR